MAFQEKKIQLPILNIFSLFLIKILKIRKFYDGMSDYLKAIFCGTISISARGCNNYLWTSTTVGKDVYPKKYIDFYEKFQNKGKKHFFELENRTSKIYLKDARQLSKFIKPKSVDYVFTSPPYANMELYEGMNAFESDHIFYTEFLIPLMNLTMRYMKENGKFCFNISPKMYKTLIERYQFPECDHKEDLRQQLGKQFKTKSQDYVYIWNKF